MQNAFPAAGEVVECTHRTVARALATACDPAAIARSVALLLLLAIVAPAALAEPRQGGTRRPNVVFILADDLGYGDVQCFNPDGKIATPQIDRLAREGMKFVDAHSGSSVCSPTRYGIMTGRYSWRGKLKAGVLGGLSPRLIEPSRMTVAAMLKSHGYRTACIGKWHLGMDWEVLPGKKISELSIETPDQVANVDYSRPIRNGPNSVGFDYFFGISASLDMVPYTFIENDHVVEVPSRTTEYPMVLGSTESKTRTGPAAAGFEAAKVLPMLTGKAVEFIGKQAADAREGRPFFLYLPLASPHTPVLPLETWQGRSGLNAYADFVMATDAAVGAVLGALDEHRLTDNTLVIFTSDNGCSPLADFGTLRRNGHDPSGGFRGAKADIYEGGHRVPFVARWPEVVQPESTSQQLLFLGDFYATVAAVVGDATPRDAAEDSVSFLHALTGRNDGPSRQSIVNHSSNGSFAMRDGAWKLCLCPDSGGWSDPKPGRTSANAPPVQLFDLVTDPAESKNLAAKFPEKVAELRALLDQIQKTGRSGQ